MFQIWFERPLPDAYLPLIADIGAAASAIDVAQAIVAGARTQFNGPYLDGLPNLRIISRTGIGVDNIDISAATERGIAVCNTPDAPTISTAEHALGLLLAVAKQTYWSQDVLRNPTGHVDFFGDYQGIELYGRTMGVVGLGRIGGHLARLAQGIGMQVVGFDPYVALARAEALGVTAVATLDELLAVADVVSLHIPHGPETHHLLDAARLAQMKPGAILINAARGGLIDEAALLTALDSGHLFGAGLDVFAEEPPPAADPLVQHPRVVVTPHVASATAAGKDRMWRGAVEQVAQFFRGQRPLHLLNPSVWTTA